MRPLHLIHGIVYCGFLLMAGERAYELYGEKATAGLSSVVANYQAASRPDMPSPPLRPESRPSAPTLPTTSVAPAVAAAPAIDMQALQSLIVDTIKSEIKNQQAIADREKEDAKEPIEELYSEAEKKERQEIQDYSYARAGDLIDSAITLQTADADFANNFFGHLRQVSPKQNIELRKKYARAVNQGLIKPQGPLELLAADR